jgi:hypothetical protein
MRQETKLNKEYVRTNARFNRDLIKAEREAALRQA